MKNFKKIYVEITNVCNLKCSFCPKSIRKNEFMKLQDIEIIFQKIKTFTDYVYLHVKGEPFLHQEIDKILDLAQKYEIKVNITTNGSLIESVKNKIISKPALRQINFSLHSFDENLPIFKNSNYFDSIFNFIEDSLINYKTIFSLRLWNLNQNNEVNLETEKNRKILQKIEKKYNINLIEEKLTPGKSFKIKERLFLNFEPIFDWPKLNTNFENQTGFCHALRTHVAILVDGTVVPCCLDGEGIINLGNIFETEFKEIINSKRSQDIFNGFSENRAVEELCMKCSFKNKFE